MLYCIVINLLRLSMQFNYLPGCSMPLQRQFMTSSLRPPIFIIGVMKGGTTALWDYLQHHPNVGQRTLGHYMAVSHRRLYLRAIVLLICLFHNFADLLQHSRTCEQGLLCRHDADFMLNHLITNDSADQRGIATSGEEGCPWRT